MPERRRTSGRLRRCQTTLLAAIAVMNVLAVSCLIFLFLCLRAQGFRGVNFPMFAEAPEQEEFEEEKLPQGVWIIANDVSDAAECCEFETDLTRVYDNYDVPYPSNVAITSSDSSLMTVSDFSTENIPLKLHGATTFRLFSASTAVVGELSSKKLISNQESVIPAAATNIRAIPKKMEVAVPSTVTSAATTVATSTSLTSSSTTATTTSTASEPPHLPTTTPPETTATTAPSTTATTMRKPQRRTSTAPPHPTAAPVQTDSRPEGTFVLVDCAREQDEHAAHNCAAWQRAGYCDSHPATKFIFCRHQCLCGSRARL